MPARRAPVTHLLYLHGFRSSPKSAKAQAMARWMREHQPQVHWWGPQLPPSPRETADMLLTGTRNWPRETMAVIGSSLGGFYATHVAEKTGCRAVLLNPAVHPARDLARYVGEQALFHDASVHFMFEPQFVDELRALECGPVARPENYLAIIAKGDEVLDWREMTGRYPGATLKLLEGSDHGLADFEEQHLPDVVAFLGLG